jgi:ABC-type nitrate/sulfonate/bicarbonate transport system substrate-binding protein
MQPRFGRVVVAVAATLAVILGTSIAASGGTHVFRSAVLAPAPQYAMQGVSADVAAKALNALAAKNARKSTHALTNVHFILNWLPNVEFSGLWMAEKFNWWGKAGIHITYTPYSTSVHPETDVPEHGGNTFGFQASAAIAIARANGVKITALYTDTQHSVFGLTVLDSSHIWPNIRNLKGKKVGYQPHELYVPQTMLAYAGLKPSDWIPRPVGFDITQLTQHAVDAYLTFVTNEPIALKLEGVKAHTFPAYQYGYHFYDDVLFTYNGLIQKNPGLVRKVVATTAEGFRWAHSHPDQAARYTVRCCFSQLGTGETRSSHLQQQILESRAFVPYSKDSTGRFRGLMTTSYWRDSINTLFKYGLIHSKPNPATIYTNRFNPYR